MIIGLRQQQRRQIEFTRLITAPTRCRT